MILLALEFSSNVRSAALIDTMDRGSCFFASEENGGHVTKPFGLIDQLLQKSKRAKEEIEAIAVGLGPGSYTGIRIGIAVAEGWRLATGVKLIGVSSVEALAAQAQMSGIHGLIDIAIDAQQREFYLAGYEISANEMSLRESLSIVPAAVIAHRQGAGHKIVGPNPELLEGIIPLFPSAVQIATLASQKINGTDSSPLIPIYLRPAGFKKSVVAASPQRDAIG